MATRQEVPAITENIATSKTRAKLREMKARGVRLRASTITVGSDRVVFVTLRDYIFPSEFIALQEFARGEGFCIR